MCDMKVFLVLGVCVCGVFKGPGPCEMDQPGGEYPLKVWLVEKVLLQPLYIPICKHVGLSKRELSNYFVTLSWEYHKGGCL